MKYEFDPSESTTREHNERRTFTPDLEAERAAAAGVELQVYESKDPRLHITREKNEKRTFTPELEQRRKEATLSDSEESN